MRNALFKDSLIYGGTDFFSKGISALLFPIFTRLLNVEDFGLLSLITIIGTMGAMLIEFGINNAVQLLYYDKNWNTDTKKLISTSFFLQLMIGVFIVSLLSLTM